MEQPSDRENELFLDALEVPATQREDFLKRHCGEDTALRTAIEALLRDHTMATKFLAETVATLSTPEALQSDSMLEAGARVGAYRILRTLGEGGGGFVYEAEQESPVRRKVALKILKSGADQHRVIARFEDERQTLALMEHPNIARVLEAGATAEGRPYFVMELVQGEQITRYCEARRLPAEERLKLMQQVCAAVQHAHQKGVIHHDLKPSNILVSEIDGIPVPKVIDFGIAKALSAKGAINSSSTGPAPLLGTPAYMSPEQFQWPAMDVDTRSDIYSLGIVLYELLVGKAPFSNEDLLQAGMEKATHKILHEIPPAPSTQGTLARRELDWLVMRSIEKNRERRYSTVRALAADIEHYLAHKPLDAHPPSPWYRLRKLVRRNRLASITLTCAALALIGGFSTSTLLYWRARAAEQQQARLRANAEEREHVARAAILLMQNRTEDADAEIRRMGGVLTQPSLEASQVFQTLGLWSAMNGDWKTSAARWLALSRVNRFDDRDMTDNATRDLLPVAPTLLEAGDTASYQAFRKVLLERLGHTNNPIAAEQVLKICLLGASDEATLSSLAPLARVAEESLPGGPETAPRNWLEAWRCIALGLWNLRTGKPEHAALWCDRALLLKNEEESRETIALLIRAMARLRAGADQEAALSDLNKARQSINKRFSVRLDYGTRGYWHDWLNARLLLREAETTAGKLTLKQ